MINKITKQEAIVAIEKYGGIMRAARALHMCDKTLRKRINGGDTHKTKFVSEKALLIDTDLETRTRNKMSLFLKNIRVGQYIRDSDFRRECGCSDVGLWNEVRTEKEFWNHAMVVGNNVTPMIYWGNETSVKSMLERGKARQPVWVEI